MMSFSILQYLYDYAKNGLIQTYMKTKENILIKYLKLKNQIIELQGLKFNLSKLFK